ncbi:MAG: tetratricopeptide repeat protein [Pseudomonadota bacterium]|nr:tetratricopeptide repeat protein [Pseudomonadota bacterium]
MALVAWKQVNKSVNKTLTDEGELARLALMNEDFALAEEIYQAWLDSVDIQQQVSALNNLGFSSVLQKKYPQSKAYFERALEQDPLNTKALNNLKLVNTLIE